jgi:hypothetical protein
MLYRCGLDIPREEQICAGQQLVALWEELSHLKAPGMVQEQAELGFQGLQSEICLDTHPWRLQECFLTISASPSLPLLLHPFWPCLVPDGVTRRSCNEKAAKPILQLSTCFPTLLDSSPSS